MSILPWTYTVVNSVDKHKSQILIAFMCSQLTSAGQSILCFAVENNRCLNRIYRAVRCRCCCDEPRSSVNWKHFQVWEDLKKPDMTTMADQQQLERVRAEANKRFSALRNRKKIETEKAKSIEALVEIELTTSEIALELTTSEMESESNTSDMENESTTLEIE